MAVARRSIYEDPFAQSEEGLELPEPATPFSSPNDAEAPSPFADLGASPRASVRLPADISLMDVRPETPLSPMQSIVEGDNFSGGGPIGGDFDPSKNTDYFPDGMPQTTSQGRDPSGFDLDNNPYGNLDKWNDPNHHTPKYDIGRAIANAGSIQAALPEIQRLYPGTVYLGGDKIGLPDKYVDGGNFLRHIDVYRDYGPGGANELTWIDQWARGLQKGSPKGGGGSGGGTGTGPVPHVSDGPGDYYGGEGGPGVFDPTNTQQAGQDPFSQIITNALGKLLEDGGRTPFGADIETSLKSLIDRGGELDEAQMRRRFESARELQHKAERTLLNEGRAELASSGLISEPGQPQGPEATLVRRITESIAPDFAREIRNITSDEADRSDDRLMTSLQLATGLSAAQAQTILAAAGAGTDRQAMLADVALRSLEQNIEWNKFLASYGLERDKLLYELNQGNTALLIPVLSAFLQYLNSSRGGYVPPS